MSGDLHLHGADHIHSPLFAHTIRSPAQRIASSPHSRNLHGHCLDCNNRNSNGHGFLWGPQGELPTALPNSFIVKMSPEEFGGRLTGRLCFFKSEVDFYNKNLGEFGGIRTPDCYFAEYNRMTGEVTLFLEDLTATRLTTVDVGNGWTVEQAKEVLSVAAKLHGRYWGMGNMTTTPDLSETVSIRHRPTLEICAEMYRRNVDAMAPIVKKVLGIEMSDAFLDFVRGSKPHMDTLTDSCYFTLDQTLTLW